jgi:hypothetical protein
MWAWSLYDFFPRGTAGGNKENIVHIIGNYIYSHYFVRDLFSTYSKSKIEAAN